MTNQFVSRAGEKLAHALEVFQIDLEGLVCADLGCSTGGFVDCALQNGATRVFAVDTGYGVLDWKLRNDERVVVRERQNALHVEFPEKVDFISIDVGWTKQKLIIPKALELLKDNGQIVTLVKPHYEAGRRALVDGKIPDEKLPEIMARVEEELKDLPLEIKGTIESPILGGKGKNKEFLAWMRGR